MEEILKGISDFVEECLGPLGGGEGYGWPDWFRDFAIQALATLLLFLVVRFFLWKPVTNLLESRRSAIDKELDEAKEAKKQAVKVHKELKAKLEQSKLDIQKLLKEAEASGNQQKEEIIKEAKLEANRRLEMAKEDIAMEVRRQEADIKNQIVEIAFMAASEIIGREVDKEKYLNAVLKIIDGGLNNDKQ